jgi:hypothetical protein
MSSVGTFAGVFAALYAAHMVGDHWVQTHGQACRKGQRDADGVRHCLAHVVTLAGTKAVALIALVLFTDVTLSPVWLVAGLVLDGASHFWADRRYTLEALAGKLRKSEFYNLGKDTVHQFTPSGSHLGTGAYALDQSWHIGWLFVAALVIAA